MKRKLFCLSGVVAALSLSAFGWEPVGGHMMTRWAKEVQPSKVLPEYPRPQLVRKDWQNLNGLWSYAIAPKEATQPGQFAGEILVPFPLESALSGVKKSLSPSQQLWYKRSFSVPQNWRDRRLVLHFGAVDWHSRVLVNGKQVGEHKGGYNPFSFDITDALSKSEKQELVVAVTDPSDSWTQPRGKQVSQPEGIWYTSVSGIWQTVWLEPVAPAAITAVTPIPDIDRGVVRIKTAGSGGARVEAVAVDGDREIGRAQGAVGSDLEIRVPSPKLWSPESPHLYKLRLRVSQGDRNVDEAESYFAMRKISMGNDRHGRLRIQLNNKPYFMMGPLDQGWWPDGLYTAPTDSALLFDIEMTKKLGYNMARKHVKVEPARWYWHCDNLGLLVWQDMPSAFLGGNGPNRLFVQPLDAKDAPRPADSAKQFEAELKEMMDALAFFPSIVFWVPFNEGWGQYDTARVTDWVKKYDPSRLVDSPSGWTDRGVGDVYDTHMYPGPGAETPNNARAIVLGEYGGLGWPAEDHLWWDKRNWGYRTLTSREAVNRKYQEVTGNLFGLLGHGLSAAIYTQTTDVEGEVNGLATYDRQLVKFDVPALTALHDRIYNADLVAKILCPSSEHSAQQWQSQTEQPSADWTSPDFNDSGWKQAAAPFHAAKDRALKGTPWEGEKLWLRRTFDVAEVPKNLWMVMFTRVGSGAVYLNGTEILKLSPDSTTSRHYGHLDLSPHAGLIRKGKNTLAVVVEQKEGARAIDVGLYALE